MKPTDKKLAHDVDRYPGMTMMNGDPQDEGSDPATQKNVRRATCELNNNPRNNDDTMPSSPRAVDPKPES